MLGIENSALPKDALLAAYHREGYYTDCYSTVVQGNVSHAAYITAFYTTRLFKVERVLLKWCIAKDSTDTEARELALGARDTFSAWRVERSTHHQLLLSDYRGRTRSWLMTLPYLDGRIAFTRLYFGSAVVPRRGQNSKSPSLGLTFDALVGFHKIYSVALLYSARRRLRVNDAASG